MQATQLSEFSEDPKLVAVDSFGITDVGHKRRTNEDQFLIADLKKSMHVLKTSLGLDHQARLFGASQGRLLLVADGIGGRESGERASALAVDTIATYTLDTLQWWFLRLEERSEDELRRQLKLALERSQERINAEAEAVPQRRGMGTTVTMAYIVWPVMYVVHVGDSRCYLVRNTTMTQVTRDHTWEQVLVETGGREDFSRWSHLLWNVVGGGQDELTPELYRMNLELGDTLLLCTDGLNRHLTDEEIATELRSDPSTEVVCKRLIERVNRAGGHDNTTLVMARFHDPDREAISASD